MKCSKEVTGMWSKLKKQFYLFTEKWGYIDKPTAKAYKQYHFSIHNLEEQNFIKRLWSVCAVEELSEYWHAFEDGEDHIKEECCDYFNFVMSGFIAMGYELKDFPPIDPKADFGEQLDIEDKEKIKKMLWELSDAIHYATNKLKNRPWTQANFKVDMGKFVPRIMNVWNLTWAFIRLNFKDWNDFIKHFNAKIDINIKRIRSKY